MKHIILLFILLMGFTPVIAQESEETSFPYGKMLKMSSDELLAAKFKYHENKNQYVLTKTNGLNQTASILGAIAGTPQNYVPHVDDYSILIQGGETGYSFIRSRSTIAMSMTKSTNSQRIAGRTFPKQEPGI